MFALKPATMNKLLLSLAIENISKGIFLSPVD
jgi:hypothetical protein